MSLGSCSHRFSLPHFEHKINRGNHEIVLTSAERPVLLHSHQELPPGLLTRLPKMDGEKVTDHSDVSLLQSPFVAEATSEVVAARAFPTRQICNSPQGEKMTCTAKKDEVGSGR